MSLVLIIRTDDSHLAAIPSVTKRASQREVLVALPAVDDDENVRVNPKGGVDLWEEAGDVPILSPTSPAASKQQHTEEESSIGFIGFNIEMPAMLNPAGLLQKMTPFMNEEEEQEEGSYGEIYSVQSTLERKVTELESLVQLRDDEILKLKSELEEARKQCIKGARTDNSKCKRPVMREPDDIVMPENQRAPEAERGFLGTFEALGRDILSQTPHDSYGEIHKGTCTRPNSLY